MAIIALNNSHVLSYLSLQKPCEIDITPYFSLVSEGPKTQEG